MGRIPKLTQPTASRHGEGEVGVVYQTKINEFFTLRAYFYAIDINVVDEIYFAKPKFIHPAQQFK